MILGIILSVIFFPIALVLLAILTIWFIFCFTFVVPTILIGSTLFFWIFIMPSMLIGGTLTTLWYIWDFIQENFLTRTFRGSTVSMLFYILFPNK